MLNGPLVAKSVVLAWVARRKMVIKVPLVGVVTKFTVPPLSSPAVKVTE
jgi:hypothetical protein